MLGLALGFRFIWSWLEFLSILCFAIAGRDFLGSREIRRILALFGTPPRRASLSHGTAKFSVCKMSVGGIFAQCVSGEVLVLYHIALD